MNLDFVAQLKRPEHVFRPARVTRRLIRKLRSSPPGVRNGAAAMAPANSHTAQRAGGIANLATRGSRTAKL